jgi:hypothetical protein
LFESVDEPANLELAQRCGDPLLEFHDVGLGWSFDSVVRTQAFAGRFPERRFVVAGEQQQTKVVPIQELLFCGFEVFPGSIDRALVALASEQELQYAMNERTPHHRFARQAGHGFHVLEAVLHRASEKGVDSRG